MVRKINKQVLCFFILSCIQQIEVQSGNILSSVNEGKCSSQYGFLAKNKLNRISKQVLFYYILSCIQQIEVQSSFDCVNFLQSMKESAHISVVFGKI